MSTHRRRQQGFTLIELSIAVLIGLFLIGGLLVMLQGNRRAFNSQNQLAALQDNERLAMTLITDVVQSAGYFPLSSATPTNTAAGMLPAAAPFVAGQSIYGVANGTASLGDVLRVRFDTANNDTILNCNGGTNTSGSNKLYTNEFSIATTTNLPAATWPFTSTWALVCKLTTDTTVGTPLELVTGLTRMDVQYGVKRNTASSSNSADIYLTVAQMAAADWSNVMSIKVTLTFQNPVYVAGQTGVLPTVAFTRVIGVMNQGGVKL